MARQIVIDIVGDASKFGKATSDATTKAGGLGSSFKQTAVGGLAMGAAFSVVNSAIGFVTDAISGASEAAKEDTASQDRLALALKNTGQAQALTTAQIEAAISANQAKGVSDSEQRQGISDFLDLTGSATEAMALNTATIELAAAKGIAYADAEAMIKSAAAGKTAALQKAGVEVEKGASITEIATAVNDKFGGSLEAVAQTQSGKSAIANEKMGEAMERVGRIINDVSTVVLPILLGAFADIVDFLMDNVVPVLSDIAKVVVPVLRRAFEIMAPIIKGVFEGIGKAAQIMAPILKAVFDGIVGATRILSGAFTGVGAIATGVFAGVVRTIKGAVNAAIGAVNGIIRAINRVQVHIHLDLPDPLPDINFDWWGLRLGQLAYLHSGGVVPGMPGSNVLAVLQAGERVTPAGTSATTVNIYISEGAFIDGPSVDRLARVITERMRLAGVA